MLNHRSALALAAIAAITLSACSTNTTNTNVVSTGTVTATFNNSNGKPVAGATVAVSPDVSAIVAPCPVTAADGTWSCNLPTGIYTLTVSGTGVTRTTLSGTTTVLAGQTTALGTKVVPYSPIVLSLATVGSALAAGFNAPVTVNATVSGASGTVNYSWGTSGTIQRAAPADWTKGTPYTRYKWVQNGGNVYECETSGTSAASGSGPSDTTAGVDIADGTVVWNYLGAAVPGPALSGSGTSATFTTESFAFLTNPSNFIVRNQDLPNRPGLVGITVGDGEYMGYKVNLGVTDAAGYTQNATLTVYPASFSHGTSNNPVGSMIVATDGDSVGNVPWATNSWTMTYAPIGGTPSDATAQLHDPTAQHPWFFANAAGDYTLTDAFTVPAWTASTTYAVGADVSNGSNVYRCTTAGQSAASGGPTGTNVSSNSITDGGAKWQFLRAYAPISFTVHVDTFSGVGACGTCHGAGGMAAAPKPQYAAWTTSAHALDPDLNNGASLFQNELAGLERGGQTCLRCHTTGNDPGQSGNLGFSDNMTADGWTYPATTVAWSTVPANLQKFGSVQCESCHGPVGIMNLGGGHSPAVSYNASLCGRCHDYNVGSYHDRYSLWSLSPTGHSLRSLAQRGAVDRSPVNLTADATTGYYAFGAAVCARCHTAQGFAAYVKQQLASGVGAPDSADPCYGSASGDYLANYGCFLNDPSLVVTQQATTQTTAGLNTYLTSTLGLTADNVEPQTCQACHDPHTTGLRLEEDTHVLPSGFRVQGAGAGALCMLCHNSRNGARGDSITQFPYSSYTIHSVKTAIRAVGTPHDSTAADIFSGNNAFFTDAYVQKTGKHLLYAEDTCVGCHVNVNVGGLSLQSKAPNHTFKVDTTICFACHDNADLLTDPSTGIQATFDAMMGTSTTGLSGAIGAAATAAVGNFIAVNPGTNATLKVKITGNTLGVDPSPSVTLASVNLGAISIVTGPAIDNEGSSSHGQATQSSLVVYFNDGTNGGMPIITSLANITWVGNDQNGTPNQDGRPIFAPAGLLARAIYNNMLLTNDQSKGIHNWSYVQNVITNTTNLLNAYAAQGPTAFPKGVTAP